MFLFLPGVSAKHREEWSRKKTSCSLQFWINSRDTPYQPLPRPIFIVLFLVSVIVNFSLHNMWWVRFVEYQVYVNDLSPRFRMQRHALRTRSVNWCWRSRSWSGRRYSWASLALRQLSVKKQQQKTTCRSSTILINFTFPPMTGIPPTSNRNSGKPALRVAHKR